MDGLLKRLERNANAVGMHLAGATKKKISKGQPIASRMKRSQITNLSSATSFMKDRSRGTTGTSKATPGAPPRVLTGRLRQSIDYKVRSSALGNSVSVAIGAHTEYARWLELGPGTSAGSITSLLTAAQAHWGNAHPYLRPTIAENRTQIVQKFARGLF